MMPTRLISLPPLANAPAPYVVFDDSGRVLSHGVLTPDPAEPPPQIPTVAVAPGSDVLVRWLDLPPGSVAQQRAAALWALRDDLAGPTDGIRVALGPPAAAGEPRLTVLVNDRLLRAWTDYLDALGVKAQVLAPDMLMIPEPEDEQTLSVADFGPVVAMRGRRFAATVQPDLASLVAGGRTMRRLEGSDAIESLIAAAKSPPVNLLATPTDSRASGRAPWRLVAGLAAAVAATPFILLAAAGVRDAAISKADETRALTTIERLLPEAAASSDPLAAADRRLASPPLPQGSLAAIASFFAAVEGVEGAELDALNVDEDGGISAVIAHSAYGDIGPISERLEADGISVTETGAEDSGGRVISTVNLGGRP